MSGAGDQVAPATERPLASVAVLGGGISGLAAAQRLAVLAPALRLAVFEAQPRPGGVLATHRQGEWLVEAGADSFVTNVPWGLDLAREVGLEGELLSTHPGQRRAFVVRRGRLYPVPEGFVLLEPTRIWPLVTTRLLSPLGKLRLALEPFVPPRRTEEDESLASFARRRLGRETFERIVQPLAGGIYTADPERLSMQATMARFVEMERRYGSLFRAARHAAAGRSPEAAGAGARYELFVAPRLGMGQLVDALAARLPPGSLRLATRVSRLGPAADGGWQIESETAGAPQRETFDAVVVALPAPQAAPLLSGVDRELGELVGQIPYAGCTVAVAGYDCRQLKRPLDGFGFVVPAVENRPILAVSYASQKFSGRAPSGHALVRVFLGGACQPQLAELDDAELRELVARELAELAGIEGAPQHWEVARWQGRMPQYHVGHCQLVARIERRAAQWPRLALAGNAYHGVGVPLCIRSGRAAAERLLGRGGAGSADAAGP